MDTRVTPEPSEPQSSRAAKPSPRLAPLIARVLLGLVFFVFGLNGFLHFIPMSKNLPEAAGSFLGALAKAGYMLPLVMGTQLLVGILLLTNRFVPLALALLAPVVLNILLFHLFLAPSGLVLAIVVLALELYLAWAYRKAFAPMLAARVRPD